jgi:hypothetical protein
MHIKTHVKEGLVTTPPPGAPALRRDAEPLWRTLAGGGSAQQGRRPVL